MLRRSGTFLTLPENVGEGLGVEGCSSISG